MGEVLKQSHFNCNREIIGLVDEAKTNEFEFRHLGFSIRLSYANR